MFSISDEDRPGRGPAYVTMAIVAINVVVT
jgi:hypothetical protein